MEDDGGSTLLTPVTKELKEAQHKVIAHFSTAYGIKPQKVGLNFIFIYNKI